MCQYNRVAPQPAGREERCYIGGWPTDCTPKQRQNRGEVAADVEREAPAFAARLGVHSSVGLAHDCKSVLTARLAPGRST